MQTKLLLNSRSAATMLDLSERSLRQLVLNGGIPFVKLGRHYRFDPDDLKAWILTNKTTTERAA